MSKTAIVTDKAPKALGPYSAGVVSNGSINVSGQLGIDPATGKLAGDDYFGSIYWAGDDRYHVRMKELSKYARVTEGEEVVSSGFSQYFPADVLIGYVESFSLADTQMAYDVVIRLAVDVSQLTDVILVRNRDIEDVQELEAEAERQNRR